MDDARTLRPFFVLLVLWLSACDRSPAAALSGGGAIRHEGFVQAFVTCPTMAPGQTRDGKLLLFNRLRRPLTVTAITAPTGSPIDVELETPLELPLLGRAEVDVRCRFFADGAGRHSLSLATSEGPIAVQFELVGAAPRALVFARTEPVEVPAVSGKRYSAAFDISLTNTGSGGPLLLTSAPRFAPEYYGARADFDPSEVSVGAAETTTLRFVATAQPGDDGVLHVSLTTNDPRRPVIDVPVELRAVPRGECTLRVDRPIGGATRIRLTNTGSTFDAICDLSGLHVEPALQMTPSASRQRLAPGAAVDFEFDAPSVAQARAAELVFYANGPAFQPARVPLAMEGADDCFVVLPADVDFGAAGVGCSPVLKYVTAYNRCDEPAATSAQVANTGCTAASCEQFQLASLSGFEVPPMGSVTAAVRFVPKLVGPASATLTFSFVRAGRISSQVAALSARTDVPPLYSESWVLPSQPQADVLFVVGMPDLIQRDAGHVRAQLATAQLPACGDYRFAVVRAGDGGTLMQTSDGGVVISAQGQAAWTMTSALVEAAAVGSDRSTIESLVNVLTSTPPFAPDGGFFRSAPRAVLFNDGTDSSPDSIASYRAQLRNTWGSWQASAVAPVSRSDCTDGRTDNGRLASFDPSAPVTEICDPYWFSSVAIDSPCRLGDEQFLSARPYEERIELRRNGQLIPKMAADGGANWTYDAVSNSVAFTPGVVSWNDVIDAEYPVACLMP